MSASVTQSSCVLLIGGTASHQCLTFHFNTAWMSLHLQHLKKNMQRYKLCSLHTRVNRPFQLRNNNIFSNKTVTEVSVFHIFASCLRNKKNTYTYPLNPAPLSIAHMVWRLSSNWHLWIYKNQEVIPTKQDFDVKSRILNPWKLMFLQYMYIYK